MAKTWKQILANPKNVRFNDLKKICDEYFGEPRINGSHHFYKTPWPGDPIVNIQKANNGKAKDYQVKQVKKAIEKLEGLKNEK